jgi:acyl-CoA synthetase (AMP-forming)/AMP-acid ligase II
MLHTSGTTARPKIVPLTQANLRPRRATSAGSLELTPADRCLNIMPLFHIHGLIAATLSSLGGRRLGLCTPGFNALRSSPRLEEAKPTWYTAVPTMHQAILARGAAQPRGRAAAGCASSAPPRPRCRRR